MVVHLPIHASWLNQVEIYFFVVQRKLLTPNDLPICKLSNTNSSTFRIGINGWLSRSSDGSSRADLTRLLSRLDANDTLKLSA